MGCAAAFLQVPWTPAAEPCQSIFRTQAMAPRPQKLPAFPDFMECGKAWPSGIPPVDSTIMALVKAPLVGGLARDPACPNPQYKVMETYLKRANAVGRRQLTCQKRQVCLRPIWTVYCTRPRSLSLLSSMLLQISGLQGQALGRSLTSLIVAHRQLFLMRIRPRC
ncbi:UNVERIFIED_CONTAM: hypothetical protein FKN15_014753 [Acipenser sinensis]